jgi:hypothetical protein
MADEDRRARPVKVSRRIAAPAARIFAVLADPNRHPEIDGSGMLRGLAAGKVITGTGVVFAMNMYFEPLCRAVHGGQNWIEGMVATLARLDRLCRGDSAAPRAAPAPAAG